MTALELAANLVMATSILLAARNSVHTWWTGMIGCVLFALLFQDAQLYADVALQGFFILTSGYGWWLWVRGENGTILPVRHAPLRVLAAASLVALVCCLAYGALLHRFTDAYAPFADSAVLAFSVLAQWLLMQRRIETWVFWLLVNSIAVPLFASRGLSLTAALYAAYWLNAWFGWWQWRRALQAA
jgi:nicotinamide mononucleotide transporter